MDPDARVARNHSVTRAREHTSETPCVKPLQSELTDSREGYDQDTSEIVPEPPPARPARATAALTLPFLMHKGCTGD
jgi:hypothetical protein